MLRHQNTARQDFIKLLEVFFKKSERKKILGNVALNFVKILEDKEAEILIKSLSEDFPQTVPTSHVKEMEKIYGKT
jgi:hypothetical protein